MIAEGRATGTLTFTNADGSVTISLVGLDEQPGFAPIPKWWRYHVVSATGDYTGLKDQGTLRIDFHQQFFYPLAAVDPIGPIMPDPLPPLYLNAGTFRIAI
jgi:hypothetical protein